MLSCGIKYFIFSSTAAVYGNPQEIPIPEDHPLRPVNPYGETKKVVEAMLSHCARALAWFMFPFVTLTLLELIPPGKLVNGINQRPISFPVSSR